MKKEKNFPENIETSFNTYILMLTLSETDDIEET